MKLSRRVDKRVGRLRAGRSLTSAQNALLRQIARLIVHFEDASDALHDAEGDEAERLAERVLALSRQIDRLQRQIPAETWAEQMARERRDAAD
jgi:uncharacterized protein Yka (UPF0111/DUF47 family)